MSGSNNSRWVAKPSPEMMAYLEGDERKRIKLFRKLDQEEPDTNEPDVKDYLKAFREWKSSLWENHDVNFDKSYEMMGNIVRLPETESEIQALLDSIAEEDADCAGVFVSYCVNELYAGDEIALKTREPIGYLGTFTRKRWTISGNAGDYAGREMHGGELIISGNAGDHLGCFMTGGKIVVEGDAGMDICKKMTGGDIFINGEHQNISFSMQGGNVYHKGKQIYKNGEPVGLSKSFA